MPPRKKAVNAVSVVRIDLGRLLPKVTKTDVAIKRSLTGARTAVDQLRASLEGLSATLKELESKDTLGNFEIQDLMSRFNQAERLASNVQKKHDDTANAVIGKI